MFVDEFSRPYFLIGLKDMMTKKISFVKCFDIKESKKKAQILQSFYTDYKEVKKLIKGGDVEYLRANINECLYSNEAYGYSEENDLKECEEKELTQDENCRYCCVFYGKWTFYKKIA